DLLTIVRASVGLRSNQSASHSLQMRCTNDLTPVLPSLLFVCTSNCGVLTLVLPGLVLVWPSNWGSLTLTDTIAASPSRMSSPDSAGSLSLSSFLSRAERFTVDVSAERNPSSCVPPSCVLIVFANV